MSGTTRSRGQGGLRVQFPMEATPTNSFGLIGEIVMNLPDTAKAELLGPTLNTDVLKENFLTANNITFARGILMPAKMLLFDAIKIALGAIASTAAARAAEEAKRKVAATQLRAPVVTNNGVNVITSLVPYQDAVHNEKAIDFWLGPFSHYEVVEMKTTEEVLTNVGAFVAVGNALLSTSSNQQQVETLQKLRVPPQTACMYIFSNAFDRRNVGEGGFPYNSHILLLVRRSQIYYNGTAHKLPRVVDEIFQMWIENVKRLKLYNLEDLLNVMQDENLTVFQAMQLNTEVAKRPSLRCMLLSWRYTFGRLFLHAEGRPKDTDFESALSRIDDNAKIFNGRGNGRIPEVDSKRFFEPLELDDKQLYLKSLNYKFPAEDVRKVFELATKGVSASKGSNNNKDTKDGFAAAPKRCNHCHGKNHDESACEYKKANISQRDSQQARARGVSAADWKPGKK